MARPDGFCVPFIASEFDFDICLTQSHCKRCKLLCQRDLMACPAPKENGLPPGGKAQIAALLPVEKAL
jgi:hypothetical protein